MKISYKKLWMLLIQKDITKVRMKRDLGLAAGTMSKPDYDSKSVCAKAHKGSNPFLSAIRE